jgi:23S rRNA (guanosine2251-2'-O)-methyltransferase
MSKSRYITGLRAVEQILATDASDVRRIFAEYQTANPRVEAIIKSAQKSGIEVQAANRARLAQMSGEERHQGVIAEVQRSTTLDESGLRTMVETRLAAADGKPLLLLVLDGVQDPHNLGACLRTAGAAGVQLVILTKDHSAGLTPVARRSASGAAEVLPILFATNLARVLRRLKEQGVWLLGTSDRAEQSLYEANLAGPMALVMGSEEKGMRRLTSELCDFHIRIPMHGTVSSLNVSVATGVCLFEMTRQRGAA